MRILFTVLLILFTISVYSQNTEDTSSDREVWIDMMCRIVDPVLRSAAEGKLQQNMPYESIEKDKTRCEYSYLEALGRTICGVAPWLEQEVGEEEIKEEYRRLARESIAHAVNPNSSGYICNVKSDKTQYLVDAAYLAQGILRAPTQLWGRFDEETKSNVIKFFKEVRVIKPGENNWLLFASIVEAALLEFTGECNYVRMLYGVYRFKYSFYKGDGFYGDGVNFHMDYYNSYVIHPMLLDVLTVMERHKVIGYDFLEVERRRHTRYSEILERQISPDGTYPIVGRTIAACRTGVFHSLSQGALLDILPNSVTPAQVRCALTAVIVRQFESPDNFDENGWLKIGIAGSQIEVSEKYVNTGSLYHSTTVFLALGLPPSHPFWSGKDEPWTSVKAWRGMRVYPDKALDESNFFDKITNKCARVLAYFVL